MAARSYSVGLVGEASYQAAIAAVGEGETAILFHEPDNPFDDRAIAVACHGDTIGYVPRGSWLTRALLDEEKGCTARIRRLARGPDRITGVTIEVELEGDQLRERDYQARD